MIQNVILAEQEEAAAYKFYHLSTGSNSWYFECLVITYDVSHYKRAQILQQAPQSSRTQALGMYNIWLIEQQLEHHNLIKWIGEMQDEYYQKVKIHLQELGTSLHNFSFYRSMNSFQEMNEMLIHMKFSGYLQLLLETYEDQENWDQDSGINTFVSLIVTEHKLHRLSGTVVAKQQAFEQELKKIREGEEENQASQITHPSFLIWMSESDNQEVDYDIESESEDEENEKNQAIIQALQQRPPLSKTSLQLHQACGICLNNFEINDLTLDLKVCEHLFHSKCIKQWLAKKCECPLCKREIN